MSLKENSQDSGLKTLDSGLWTLDSGLKTHEYENIHL